MDSFNIENDVNHEEKSQEIQVLIPNPPQYAIAPIQNDFNRLQLPSRDRSFCIETERSLSRRPSAIVTAIQREQRRSSTSRIFFE